MDDELYENRHGEEVEWDDLDEAAQSFYDSGGHGQSITIEEYCENYDRGQSGLEIDDEGNWHED